MDGGLDGVVVAETVMSDVDGAAGALTVRGLPVARLAARGRLEDAIALLWDGEAPGGSASDRVQEALGQARVAWWPVVRSAPALGAADPAVAARAAVASLERVEDLELVAVVGLVLAAWAQQRSGHPVPPDPTLPHADDLARMLRGATDPARGTALGRYLCAVADHGMNASTFAARVVASTGSDAPSAVAAAIGALMGPLHGGAPGPVLDMLDAIGAPEAAGRWIDAELAAGRRIMGMGHRVYRVRDPRVAVLEGAIAELGAAGVATERLALARAVEAAAEAALARHKPDRPLKANVEFATAVLLDAIGIPREAFTATFAAGRVVGWLAHVREQRAVGRLIRPSSRYVGPRPA
jgi:citrate synthase